RNFLVCLNLGNMAARRGDWPAALKMFREARALEPSSDDVEADLGGVLLATGAENEAETHLARALTLNPQNRAALRNDALLWVRRGDDAAAKALLDRLLALDPNDGWAIAQRSSLERP